MIFTGDRAQGTKMEYMCIFSYMLFNQAQEMQVYGVLAGGRLHIKSSVQQVDNRRMKGACTL